MKKNRRMNFKNEFDLNIALTSFALINIDEFDKTTNSQQIVLKYLLSSSDVKFRPPYGKTIKQYRRYTSFIGTANQLQPLVDPTGSRRFVCVGIPAGKNIDFTDNLDHRQLYAQALHLFNTGERFWLDDDEIQALIEENVPYRRSCCIRGERYSVCFMATYVGLCTQHLCPPCTPVEPNSWRSSANATSSSWNFHCAAHNRYSARLFRASHHSLLAEHN